MGHSKIQTDMQFRLESMDLSPCLQSLSTDITIYCQNVGTQFHLPNTSIKEKYSKAVYLLKISIYNCAEKNVG